DREELPVDALLRRVNAREECLAVRGQREGAPEIQWRCDGGQSLLLARIDVAQDRRLFRGFLVRAGEADALSVERHAPGSGARLKGLKLTRLAAQSGHLIDRQEPWVSRIFAAVEQIVSVRRES